MHHSNGTVKSWLSPNTCSSSYKQSAPKPPSNVLPSQNSTVIYWEECTFLALPFHIEQFALKVLKVGFGPSTFQEADVSSNRELQTILSQGGFPKLGVPFFGVHITRTIVLWGLYWGPLRRQSRNPPTGPISKLQQAIANPTLHILYSPLHLHPISQPA